MTEPMTAAATPMVQPGSTGTTRSYSAPSVVIAPPGSQVVQACAWSLAWIACFGWTPTICSTSLPSRKMRRVGMLLIRNRWAVAGLASTSSLPTTQRPADLAASWSIVGRDGPAGRAPRRPGVHQHRPAARHLELGFEVSVCHHARVALIVGRGRRCRGHALQRAATPAAHRLEIRARLIDPVLRPAVRARDDRHGRSSFKARNDRMSERRRSGRPNCPAVTSRMCPSRAGR